MGHRENQAPRQRPPCKLERWSLRGQWAPQRPLQSRARYPCPSPEKNVGGNGPPAPLLMLVSL